MYLSILLTLFLLLSYFVRFYPRQICKSSSLRISIYTPDEFKYKNDCLHPCVRYIEGGFVNNKWWLVQTPYYMRNSLLENPLLYCSDEKNFPLNWKFSSIVKDTPAIGFNSDPTIFYENNKLWVFWREYQTENCKEVNADIVTFGSYTIDGYNFSQSRPFLINIGTDEDKEQSPILIKRNGKYQFYTVDYRYFPQKGCNGIAIWEGDCLEQPNFIYKYTLKFSSVYTCDKYKQLKLFGTYLFIPKPLLNELWHFDLIEYNGLLLILWVSEWGDNIMLSYSFDYEKFNHLTLPLINSHVSQQFYLYKPTGSVVDNELCFYYTAVSKQSVNCNELFMNKIPLSKLGIYKVS